MTKGIPRRTLAATLWLALLVGCVEYTTPRGPESRFFTCNDWVDRNLDGYIGRDEWVGAKNEFRLGLDRKVTLVAILYGKKGMNVKYHLYGPRGDLLHYEEFSVVSSQGDITHIGFDVRKLYEEGGIGEWTVEWYLEKNRVYVGTFTVSN